MHDASHIGRRALLTGLGAGAALAATPALAQIPGFGFGGGAVGDLLGSVTSVISGMKLGEADEIAMGNGYYERFINQSGGRYNGRAAQAALRDFARPVIATSKRAGLPWEIALIDNETVNAWALPAGKIGIHKGLIRYAATSEELAAVISHEVAHAEFSHGIAQIKNKKFIQGMSGVAKQQIVQRVGRGSSGSVGAFVTNEVLTAFEGPIFEMITSGYSQDLEYAADAHIVNVFRTNGYDTTRATGFYATMLRLVPRDTKATTSLYATHPGTQDRIKRLEKAIAKDKPPAGAGGGHPGWAELKQSFPTRTRFRLA